MKRKNKGKTAAKKPALTKSLGALMKDEDGFVSKETILKVGLSTVAALGVVGSIADNGSTQTHTNVVSAGGPCLGLGGGSVNHTNVATHTSY